MAGPQPQEPTERSVAPGAEKTPGVPAGTGAGASAGVPGAPEARAPGPSFLERLPWFAVPAILLGVPLLAWLVAQVYPPFYDQVIWQYYWGPIKADAFGVSDTVGMCLDESRGPVCDVGPAAFPGYNVVNTASWAVLLGVCIVGLAQMLQRFRVAMDNTLILGATAWVLPGSVFHVMQDAGLFDRPLEYFFITPPIYLLFAAGGVLSLLVGLYAASVARGRGLEAGLQKLWFVMVVVLLAYTLLWAMGWEQVVRYVHPVWVALFGAATFLIARWRFVGTGRIAPSEVVLILPVWVIATSLAYVAQFILDPWSPSDADALRSAAILTPTLALAAVAFVVLMAKKAPRVWTYGLAVLAVLAVGAAAGIAASIVADWLGDNVAQAAGTAAVQGGLAVVAAAGGLVWALRRVWPSMTGAARVAEVSQAYLRPMNLVLIFSQMVDAFSTSIGLDLRGYTEKHVLSGIVIDSFEGMADAVGWQTGLDYSTFLSFAPLKFLVSLAVVYAIDVYSKEDAERYPVLIGLVKFAIIMVGIGPGVRNFTRLSLGV